MVFVWAYAKPASGFKKPLMNLPAFTEPLTLLRWSDPAPLFQSERSSIEDRSALRGYRVSTPEAA